jgi:hypothetical protein
MCPAAWDNGKTATTSRLAQEELNESVGTGPFPGGCALSARGAYAGQLDQQTSTSLTLDPLGK